MALTIQPTVILTSCFIVPLQRPNQCLGRRSDFNGLHSRKHDFDVLISDGDDLRKLPLSMRKTNLARLLARRVDGIFLSDFEQGEIGPELFRHACLMGLEGLVSKHRESTYRAGRYDHWIKVKNRKHPAYSRVIDTKSP